MRPFIAIFLSFTPLICSLLSATIDWETTQNQTLLKMTAIPGWCSDAKALLILETIQKNRCQICVEIGVFAGKSLLPAAMALQYNGEGKLYGIDAWDSKIAVKNFNPADPNFTWWNQLDLHAFYIHALRVINTNQLHDYCFLIRAPSYEAVNLFEQSSIDFIHFDGDHNEKGSFEDVVAYFPKVKEGGYILLNDPNWLSMRKPLVFLLERTELLTPFSPDVTYMLFRKNKQREAVAQPLLKDSS